MKAVFMIAMSSFPATVNQDHCSVVTLLIHFYSFIISINLINVLVIRRRHNAVKLHCIVSQ